jgi:hypothetical protein
LAQIVVCIWKVEIEAFFIVLNSSKLEKPQKKQNMISIDEYMMKLYIADKITVNSQDKQWHYMENKE